eukprot:4937932-Karenia_brevis.AAC.1
MRCRRCGLKRQPNNNLQPTTLTSTQQQQQQQQQKSGGTLPPQAAAQAGSGSDDASSNGISFPVQTSLLYKTSFVNKLGTKGVDLSGLSPPEDTSTITMSDDAVMEVPPAITCKDPPTQQNKELVEQLMQAHQENVAKWGEDHVITQGTAKLLDEANSKQLSLEGVKGAAALAQDVLGMSKEQANFAKQHDSWKTQQMANIQKTRDHLRQLEEQMHKQEEVFQKYNKEITAAIDAAKEQQQRIQGLELPKPHPQTPPVVVQQAVMVTPDQIHRLHQQ